MKTQSGPSEIRSTPIASSNRARGCTTVFVTSLARVSELASSHSFPSSSLFLFFKSLPRSISSELKPRSSPCYHTRTLPLLEFPNSWGFGTGFCGGEPANWRSESMVTQHLATLRSGLVCFYLPIRIRLAVFAVIRPTNRAWA